MGEGILLIGGATRNVGKTTFVNRVIQSFSQKHDIVGLKIKSIYEGDSFFHGKDRNPLKGNYRLIEETGLQSDEDTGRMFRAGAKKVFRLKVKSHALEEAYKDFTSKIGENCLVICESNSLRKIIEPDVFLLIKHKNKQNIKPSAKELEQFADKIIYTDGEKHDFNPADIEVEDNKWRIRS